MKTVRFKDSTREITVGKILCLGQNYAEHAKEMKGRLPEKPMIFLKPSTALLPPGAPIRLPAFSCEIHHEVELVVVVGRELRNATPEEARRAIAGYAVGIDLTARDVQNEARRVGDPWTVSKGFDGSAPVSEVSPAEEVGDAGDLGIQLRVNGDLRQSASTSEMIHKIPDVLSYASSIFTLEPGDLLFTGTPSGVGPVRPGDVLEADIETVASARWNVES